MAQKKSIDPDKFTAGPLTELNNLIESIYQEKKLFLISAKFIKVECDTSIVEVNNFKFRIHKRNYTFLPGILETGNVVVIDSRNLY